MATLNEARKAYEKAQQYTGGMTIWMKAITSALLSIAEELHQMNDCAGRVNESADCYCCTGEQNNYHPK